MFFSTATFWILVVLTHSQRRCLPHQSCSDGDCCALGSSCNTCGHGFHTNNNECAGKGNRRCNMPPTRQPTQANPPPTPFSTPEPTPATFDRCLPHESCAPGDCCAEGSSCNTCRYGFEVNNGGCAGKGNRRCKFAPPPTRATTPWPGTFENLFRRCLPHEQCEDGACCALGSSCNTCAQGFSTNNVECAGKGNRVCNFSRPPTMSNTRAPTRTLPNTPTTSTTPQIGRSCEDETEAQTCRGKGCAFHSGTCVEGCQRYTNYRLGGSLTEFRSIPRTFLRLACEDECLREFRCKYYEYIGEDRMCKLYNDGDDSTREYTVGTMLGVCEDENSTVPPTKENISADGDTGDDSESGMSDMTLAVFATVGALICMCCTVVCVMYGDRDGWAKHPSPGGTTIAEKKSEFDVPDSYRTQIESTYISAGTESVYTDTTSSAYTDATKSRRYESEYEPGSQPRRVNLVENVDVSPRIVIDSNMAYKPYASVETMDKAISADSSFRLPSNDSVGGPSGLDVGAVKRGPSSRLYGPGSSPGVMGLPPPDNYGSNSFTTYTSVESQSDVQWNVTFSNELEPQSPGLGGHLESEC